ncbi:hypothetical protein [Scytonema sp. PRP1]|uniref:hypothetical protein n=1 Tax=Scytonema sp. PRP1 TaxID=3120513 RepID=UPI00300C82BA
MASSPLGVQPVLEFEAEEGGKFDGDSTTTFSADGGRKRLFVGVGLFWWMFTTRDILMFYT